MIFLKDTDELLTDSYPSNKDALFNSASQYSQQPVEASDVFHSAEDIRRFHDQSVDARTDAFRQLTRLQNYPAVTSIDKTGSLNCFAVQELESEFSDIQNSDKADVFIEELEQLITNLCEQKPVIADAPDNINRLLQFKSSIHLIKLLSEMMQARHLNQFCQTVIEFLDDLVDGKSSLTEDVIERLSVVVNCYDHYNYCIKDSIKDNSTDKIIL